jgi:uncharacterized protein (DUF488 family)
MEDLARLLRQASVTAVADVRSQPFSQRHPEFNRPDLEMGLAAHDIAYHFFGQTLGGRPRPGSLYDAEGHVDYERVRQTDTFRRGLDELIAALEQHVVAMLCAEEDPLDCHRGLMIGPALRDRGLGPAHLRGDGSVESTEAMEDRLLALTGVGEGILDGLFAATVTAEERRELLAEAYRVQARRKGFRLRPDLPEG